MEAYKYFSQIKSNQPIITMLTVLAFLAVAVAAFVVGIFVEKKNSATIATAISQVQAHVTTEVAAVKALVAKV